MLHNGSISIKQKPNTETETNNGRYESSFESFSNKNGDVRLKYAEKLDVSTVLLLSNDNYSSDKLLQGAPTNQI